MMYFGYEKQVTDGKFSPEAVKNTIDNAINVVNLYQPGKINEATGIKGILNLRYGDFWKAKGWIISAMKRHPLYNGKGQIILKHVPMNRYIDISVIKCFKSYLYWVKKYLEQKGWRYRYAFFVEEAICEVCDYVIDNDTNLINEETANKVNCLLDSIPEGMVDYNGNPLIKNSKRNLAKKGMKATRLIQQIALKYGLDGHKRIENIGYYDQNGNYRYKEKDTGWNYQSKAVADAMTEVHKFGTFVISVNPVDYLTSSIGYKWTSCHTIDSENIRKLIGEATEHIHSGMYMAGNISYMLDSSSVVTYFLPDDYQGNTPELEEKLKRCMFHVGKDKFIQGRVYPDGRDNNDGRDNKGKSFSADIRNTFINVLREIFNIPEYVETETDWGTGVCSEFSSSNGKNYKDYLNYDDCSVTTFDGADDSKIRIGEPPICLECGETYYDEGRLFCDCCYYGGYRCNKCGDYVPEDDAVYVNGDVYCTSCATYCDRCGEGILREDATEVISRYSRYYHDSVCSNCLNDYYVETPEGDYVRNSDAVLTEEGSYFYNRDPRVAVCNCGNYHDSYNIDPDLYDPTDTDSHGRIRIRACSICAN